MNDLLSAKPPTVAAPPPGTPGITPHSAARTCALPSEPVDLTALPAGLLDTLELPLRSCLPGAPPGFLRDALTRYFDGTGPNLADPQPGPKELLSAKAVQRILGISAMTLFRLMKSGEIAVVHLSKRRIAFDPDDVTAFIAARRKCGRKRRRRRAV